MKRFSVGAWAAKGALADYYAPGATANASFFDISYGGNPSNYKTFAWGFNDSCLNQPHWESYLPASGLLGTDGVYKGRPEAAGPDVAIFRKRLPVNTFAETAPGANTEEIRRDFMIGVDRILIRTVTNPSYPPSETDDEDPRPGILPLRRAAGSPALERAWRCLHRLTATWVFDRLDHRLDPGLCPPGPIFGASGGCLVVHGSLPLSSDDYSVAIGFERTRAAASRKAGSLRRRFGSRVEAIGTAVVLWTEAGARERTARDRCLRA